jgi:regulation of enolase protein 1 (concanavalin A-like superfamily)
MGTEMDWYNEPPMWTVNGDTITIRSEPKTDSWRTTHYGFIRDNGHFYHHGIVGDFLVEVKVRGAYASLYDQAGLMVRVDEANWVKCGIEFVDGVQQVSAVVTREYSDWSVVPLPSNPAAIWLRLTRHGSAIEIRYALDGVQYQMLRLAYLTPARIMSVGLMCASPDGAGFLVTFEGFTIQSI